MQKELRSILDPNGNNDEKSLVFLTKALEKNNVPGFDYLEYKNNHTVLNRVSAHCKKKILGKGSV